MMRAKGDLIEVGGSSDPWTCVGPLACIPRRGARVVRTAWGDIAVFRTGDDSVFAVDDRCPHQAGPLSQGLVHGHRVTCPLHDTEVCLRSGRALEAPGRVAVHAVKVVEGRVFLALPTGPALPVGDSPPRA